MSITLPVQVASSFFGRSLMFTPSPDVLAQAMGDDIVLVHLHSNAIFELNATASRFWLLLSEGHTVDAICNTMLGEFEITQTQLEEEIQGLLDMLQEHNLIYAKES
jgi:hypothetical protein